MKRKIIPIAAAGGTYIVLTPVVRGLLQDLGLSYGWAFSFTVAILLVPIFLVLAIIKRRWEREGKLIRQPRIE